ncbi:MAG: hypothetical protein GEU75_10115 [Dehalococcoidia bacterium]|nr:hypothetical protein [Dehalococcoidia bacterium]
MTDTERGVQPAAVDRDDLRQQIQAKYTDVALDPGHGFHFHTGRSLARMLAMRMPRSMRYLRAR